MNVDPLAAVRKYAAAQGRGHAPSPTTVARYRPRSTASRLLGPGTKADLDLTAPVQAALTTLLGEIDELRKEVGRLKARLVEAEAEADKDPLTPLINRRAFVQASLGRVLAFIPARYGGHACLVYFDLDGFKAVNDRFGHAAGDMALGAVAEASDRANVREIRHRRPHRRRRVRRHPGSCRYRHRRRQGRLPGPARSRAGDRRPAVRKWLVPLKISYGVRQIDPDLSAEQALAAADAAMYARAQAGGLTRLSASVDPRG